jgi:hypothetical protein
VVIFTIGRKLAYEAALNDPTAKPMKAGKSEDYEGGWVWKTPEGARKHCPPGFIVYGVKADWKKDTELGPDGKHQVLKRDAEFVRLPDEFKPKHKRKH